jgi:hypothetical protein
VPPSPHKRRWFAAPPGHLWSGRFDFHRPRIAEKQMLGGVCFLRNRNVCGGIWRTSLTVRLGPYQAAAALKEPNVVEFGIMGRPMKDWIMVESDGLETHEQLCAWIQRTVAFVRELPRK